MSTARHRKVSTPLESAEGAPAVVDASSRVFDSGAIAFASTPRRFVLLRYDGAQWLDEHDDTPSDLETAFELRLFDSVREWRWNYREGGSPVRELREQAEPAATERRLGGDVRVLEPTGYARRVLGTPTHDVSADGCWIVTAEGSVGSLRVPLSSPVPDGVDPKTGWVELTALEYASENESGSAFVVGERLTGIRWSTTEGGPTS